jgi:hypothetical protein
VQPPDAEACREINLFEDSKPTEEVMFGSDGVQLLRRITGASAYRDGSDQRSPLRTEYFPVEARGREIVTQEGVMIAVATDPAMSEEIVRRLNKTYWSDQEDQWAL